MPRFDKDYFLRNLPLMISTLTARRPGSLEGIVSEFTRAEESIRNRRETIAAQEQARVKEQEDALARIKATAEANIEVNKQQQSYLKEVATTDREYAEAQKISDFILSRIGADLDIENAKELFGAQKRIEDEIAQNEEKRNRFKELANELVVLGAEQGLDAVQLFHQYEAARTGNFKDLIRVSVRDTPMTWKERIELQTSVMESAIKNIETLGSMEVLDFDEKGQLRRNPLTGEAVTILAHNPADIAKSLIPSMESMGVGTGFLQSIVDEYTTEETRAVQEITNRLRSSKNETVASFVERHPSFITELKNTDSPEEAVEFFRVMVENSELEPQDIGTILDTVNVLPSVKEAVIKEVVSKDLSEFFPEREPKEGVAGRPDLRGLFGSFKPAGPRGSLVPRLSFPSVSTPGKGSFGAGSLFGLATGSDSLERGGTPKRQVPGLFDQLASAPGEAQRQINSIEPAFGGGDQMGSLSSAILNSLASTTAAGGATGGSLLGNQAENLLLLMTDPTYKRIFERLLQEDLDR